MEITSYKRDRKDVVPNIVPPQSLFDVIEFPLHTLTSWHFGILALDWKLIPNLTLSTLPAFCCVFVPSVSTVHRPYLCLFTRCVTCLSRTDATCCQAHIFLWIHIMIFSIHTKAHDRNTTWVTHMYMFEFSRCHMVSSPYSSPPVSYKYTLMYTGAHLCLYIYIIQKGKQA